METNNIDLLEAYVNGTLTAEEQMQVENRLRTDEAFKLDYEMYQFMISAIAENRKAELKSYISKNVKVKPVQFFRTPTFYAAAAASVVLCILSYFVVYKKMSEERNVAQSEAPKTKTEQGVITNADTLNPVATGTKQVSPAPTSPAVNENVATVTDSKSKMEKSDDKMLDTHTTNDSPEESGNLSSKPEDIKVESDKMQSDSFLFIPRKIYIQKPKQYQTSPADLYTVVTSGDQVKIEVQYWQSPINFSGYRFYKNLLVIYGNYDPALASFQELNDMVYMKYKNEYYKLASTQSYSGMKKETDVKIIADLEFKDKK